MSDFKLDPDSYTAALHHFDQELGFAKFHEDCCQAFKRQTDCIELPLLQSDFQQFHTLQPEDCADLRGKMDRDDPVLNESAFARNLLRKVFTPEIDQAIISYFQSEYMPRWISFNRNDVGFEDVESFLWHFDGGPSKHLKILAYFTSNKVSGGGTEVFDRETSRRYADAGYAFPYVKHRLADLEPLAQQLSLPYNPTLLDINEGDALLFNPMNILHRAVPATKAPRYLMQVYIRPCSEKWLPFCIKNGFPEVMGEYGETENVG